MKNKRETFKKLATHRLEKAVHYIELLGNLSNTRDYEYTEEDLKIIKRALDEAKKGMEDRFKNKFVKAKITFD
tara:strand:+ start:75 stop:293 length:219 start_codon:yes stop_codon:yes gene_type:complete